jgi:hypothetical protein
VAEFDADKLDKRLEQLNREQLAALEQLSDRLLRELEAYRPGPKRADGSGGNEPSADGTARRARGRRTSR